MAPALVSSRAINWWWQSTGTYFSRWHSVTYYMLAIFVLFFAENIDTIEAFAKSSFMVMLTLNEISSAWILRVYTAMLHIRRYIKEKSALNCPKRICAVQYYRTLEYQSNTISRNTLSVHTHAGDGDVSHIAFPGARNQGFGGSRHPVGVCCNDIFWYQRCPSPI